MLSYVSLHFRIFELNCLLQQIIMIWMETNILFQVSGKGWAKGEGQSSSGSHSTSRIWNTLLQAVANYDHTFNKHGVSAMLGFRQNNLL